MTLTDGAAALFFRARGPQRGSRVGVACVDRDRHLSMQVPRDRAKSSQS